MLAAVNLRPAVTSVGPVLEEAQAGLGMSASDAGLLTSMPAVCFALVGFAAPWLASRGRDTVIAASMAAVAVGLMVRPLAAGGALFAALTALALAGIGVANVLLPVVVKQRFPERVGAMTGLYSMALNVGASTAAATTVPLARWFGGDWRIGLGAWALLAAVAVPPWLVLARRRAGSVSGSPETGPTVRGSVSRAPLTRSPTAWALALYFGLQATAAYIIIGWLPQIYRDAGLPPRPPVCSSPSPRCSASRCRSCWQPSPAVCATRVGWPSRSVCSASQDMAGCGPPQVRHRGCGPACSVSPTARSPSSSR